MADMLLGTLLIELGVFVFLNQFPVSYCSKVASVMFLSHITG